MRSNRVLKVWMGMAAFGVVIFQPWPVWGEEICVLTSNAAGPFQELLAGFSQAAAFKYEIINTSSQPVPALQQRLANSAPTLAVALGSEAVQMSAGLSPSIPVVYTMVVEPMPLGARKSLCLPITISVDEQFSRLHNYFPNRKKIGVLYNPAFSSREVEKARVAAGKYDLNLMPIAVEDQGDITTALQKMSVQNVEMLWIPVDKTVAVPAVVQTLIEYTLKNRIVLIGISVHHVRAGALLAFSADYQDMGRQTAVAVLGMQQGTQTASIQNPRKIIVYVNPQVQEKIGVNSLNSYAEVQLVQ